MLRATRAARVGLVPVCSGALHGSRVWLQKKPQTATNAYLAGASKTGNEEKWAQAAMEYIYEKNHVNDSRKRAADVASERRMAAAYDRYCAVNAAHFEKRLGRLIFRMNESLEKLQELGLHECLEEALVLNSEQPPGNYRRPSLTPPVQGYEPGFGLDVPQLRSQQAEYPAVVRPTDALQFSASGIVDGSGLAFAESDDGGAGGAGDGAAGDESVSYFPFVDAHQMEDLTARCGEELEAIHGDIREAAPMTGVEGEGWEAYVALQKKALARQQLIFDLSKDPVFRELYDAEESVRLAEWEKRGLLPLLVEGDDDREGDGGAAQREHAGKRAGTSLGVVVDDWAERVAPPTTHYAQVPAYQPFRSS